MIGPFFSCEIGKTWGTENDKKPYVKWEKARKPLSNGRKWANFLPRNHVTDLMSEQVSDFRFGHQKWPFWEWEKATFTAFPHSRKGPSGAQNENLRPVLTLGLWRGYVVRNSLTFGHWKVVFSLFLILYRAFSHFMYPTFCQFRKRKMVQSWFQKVFWNKDCDVFGNLVVEIKNFNFCLFVCLFVCLYLTFCQFRKWKMV